MYLFVLFILFSLIMKSTHLLSVLINLEFLGLFIFFLFAVTYLVKVLGVNILVALLVAMGCESVVGLVIFVALSRAYSKDYFLSVGLFSF